MTLYAYTELTHPYPAYVNVREDADATVLTVRERGHGGARTGVITLNDEQATELALAMLRKAHPDLAMTLRVMLMSAGKED